jgi:ABC-type nitrate/sulfonate/bicarbonate transport system permease component
LIRAAGRVREVSPLLAIIAFLLAWQAAATSGWINRAILASPSEVFLIAIVQATDGSLFRHAGVSFARVLGGFALGATLGVVLGLAMGRIEVIRRAVNPIVEVMRPIPPLAWIPLAIIWFGIGEASKIFLIAVTVFFPVVVNTYKGVAHIDPVLIRAARSLDARLGSVLVGVALPAAMPDIATGLRISWSLSWAVLVAAEMLAAKSGLGFLVTEAMNLGRFDRVIFGIMVIGLVSVATDLALRAVIDRHLLHWHQGADKARG